MAKFKVVLNRRVFGEQVMASSEVEEILRPYADAVAAQIPGSKVRTVVRKAQGGGMRVRLRVEGKQEERAKLVSAIRSVLRAKVDDKKS